MVQTRRQYNSWVQERRGRRHTAASQEECESCASEASSQRSVGNFSIANDEPDNGDMFDGVGGGARATYGDNDRCRRHRRPDDEPRNRPVRAYSRRAPTR